MEVQAKAPRKGCITSHVRQLTIKTDDEKQQAFLAALNEAILDGGQVTVIAGGKSELLVIIARR